MLFEDQRTLPGAKFPAGRFDTLIMETTRGHTERPVGKGRGAEISRLIASINETIKRGGSFLIPVFALGRMQEILAVVHDARKFDRLVDCPIYASGLGLDLADYFDEITRKTRQLNFNRSVIKELKLRPLPRQLKPGEDPKQNALYIVSSGMWSSARPATRSPPGSPAARSTPSASSATATPTRPAARCSRPSPAKTFFKAANVKTKLEGPRRKI